MSVDIIAVWLWQAVAQQSQQRTHALQAEPVDCSVCFDPFVPSPSRCRHCGSPALCCCRCLFAWSRITGAENRCVVCRLPNLGGARSEAASTEGAPRALESSRSFSALYVMLAITFHLSCHFVWIAPLVRHMNTFF